MLAANKKSKRNNENEEELAANKKSKRNNENEEELPANKKSKRNDEDGEKLPDKKILKSDNEDKDEGYIEKVISMKKLKEKLEFFSEEVIEEFKRNFEEWQSMRKASINVLEELEKGIIENKKMVERIKKFASIGQSGVALYKKLNDSDKNLINSKTGDKAGRTGKRMKTAAKTAASISPMALDSFNEYYLIGEMEKAKDALKNDKRNTDKLLPFRKKSEELNDLFKDVFGCSIRSDTIDRVFKECQQMQIISEASGKGIYDFFCEVLSEDTSEIKSGAINEMAIIKWIETLTPEVKKILREFSKNHQVMKYLLALSNTMERQPLALKMPRLFLTIQESLPDIKNTPFWEIVLKYAPKIFYTLVFDIASEFIPYVDVARDVFNIIIAAIYLFNPDKNYLEHEQCEMIKEIGKVLDDELKRVTEMYEYIIKKE